MLRVCIWPCTCVHVLSRAAQVDALCPRRDGGRSHDSRVVAQLLTLLDGAATGRATGLQGQGQQGQGQQGPASTSAPQKGVQGWIGGRL